MIESTTKCVWQMREWIDEAFLRRTSEYLSGWDSARRSARGTSSSNILIFAGEEGIDGEDNSIDDGQRALGNSEGLSVIRGEADEFAGGAFVPELQDDDTADDEQDATNGGVEEIWKELLCQWTASNQLLQFLPILLLIGVLTMNPAKIPTKMIEKPTKVPLISIIECWSDTSDMLL